MCCSFVTEVLSKLSGCLSELIIGACKTELLVSGLQALLILGIHRLWSTATGKQLLQSAVGTCKHGDVQHLPQGHGSPDTGSVMKEQKGVVIVKQAAVQHKHPGAAAQHSTRAVQLPGSEPWFCRLSPSGQPFVPTGLRAGPVFSPQCWCSRCSTRSAATPALRYPTSESACCWPRSLPRCCLS